MGIVEKQTATVYYAPTRGRRYFSKQAAKHAEAVAMIYKKHPPEPPEYDHETCRLIDPGWSIKYDEPDRYGTMVRRLTRLLKTTPTGE